jgi:YebC/PmpR family DNA-binding regulatory protein
MSGHSHFATIKRQKENKDAAKGNLFGKLSKMISIAIKAGGGPNPDMNFRLRVAIDKARESNMPKENIDRILKAAEEKQSSLEEITYEGFGPNNSQFIIETATDNKNRTSQEIKNILEKHGGGMGGPNSVAYNFDNKGYLLIKKNPDTEEQMLTLIDLGAEDVEEVEEGIEVFTETENLKKLKEEVEGLGFEIVKMELIKKPRNYIELGNTELEKLYKIIDVLYEHDDVQKVFTNF